MSSRAKSTFSCGGAISSGLNEGWPKRWIRVHRLHVTLISMITRDSKGWEKFCMDFEGSGELWRQECGIAALHQRLRSPDKSGRRLLNCRQIMEKIMVKLDHNLRLKASFWTKTARNWEENPRAAVLSPSDGNEARRSQVMKRLTSQNRSSLFSSSIL